MKYGNRLLLVAFLFAVVVLASCSDEEGPTEVGPTAMTITVDPTPHSIDATWLLTGPDYSHEGVGKETLNDLPSGPYTVTWYDVDGYITPGSRFGILADSASLTFTGFYVETVLVPAGSFSMGSPPDEPGRGDDEVLHDVTLSRGFYMTVNEVTTAWWDDVMGDGESTSQLPKVQVSWDDAVAFCNRISQAEGLTPAYTIQGSGGGVIWNQDANGYRLPTEAEWEYACRAGSETAFANGPITHVECSPRDAALDQIGWYCGNASARQPVGKKQPNAWGLHDMNGNEWEWVWDGYRSDYENLESVDPVHHGSGSDHRVRRGGYWRGHARYSRSACRSHYAPDDRHGGYGFRPVRTAF